MFEAFRIHTVDQFPYEWKRVYRRAVSDKTIREIIGESIPPAGFKVIVYYVVKIYRGGAQKVRLLRDRFSPLSQPESHRRRCVDSETPRIHQRRGRTANLGTSYGCLSGP